MLSTIDFYFLTFRHINFLIQKRGGWGGVVVGTSGVVSNVSSEIDEVLHASLLAIHLALSTTETPQVFNNFKLCM